VDVVGDVHKLSQYFDRDRFDVVFAISVFEHILFPWKAVLEINRVMCLGGCLLVTTHPAWPAHELPWDFWRFQQNGFIALLNKHTGFEIQMSAEGLPAQAYSLVSDPPTRGLAYQPLNQGVAVMALKTGNYREDLLRWDIELSEVTRTMYPQPVMTQS
jgi:hypothetical protein